MIFKVTGYKRRFSSDLLHEIIGGVIFQQKGTFVTFNLLSGICPFC